MGDLFKGDLRTRPVTTLMVTARKNYFDLFKGTVELRTRPVTTQLVTAREYSTIWDLFKGTVELHTRPVPTLLVTARENYLGFI